jgi:hypothetical protein
MQVRLGAALIVALGFSFALVAQTAPQSSGGGSAQPRVVASSICGGSADYDQLTADERNPPKPHAPMGGNAPVELTIMAVEFNDKPADPETAADPAFCFWHLLGVGVQLTTSGEAYSFADGEGAFRGGGGGTPPPEVLARLHSLMERLPDDHRRVPPPTRRVTVTVERNGSAIVRLYDSANLPDEILEMLRLTGARIQVMTPVLKPDRVVPPEEAASLRLSVSQPDENEAVSPDGSIGVSHDFQTRTLTVYEVGKWPQPRKTIRTIPEFWQPQYGEYGVDSEFSPDGRFLLVTWGSRIGALLFDTSTWEPITDPNEFPQNLKEYLHSPDWRWGIAVTKAGETIVWDQQAHRIVSKLPGLGAFERGMKATDPEGHELYTEGSAEIRGAAFSADGARIALFHGPNDVNVLRLSVFNVSSGTKERDLWPVEWMAYADGQPVWWNDNRWVIAPWSGQFSGKGTGVWDVVSGRFIAALDLSDCDARESPTAQGTRLLQPCFAGERKQGKVLEWSLDAVRQQLAPRKGMSGLTTAALP